MNFRFRAVAAAAFALCLSATTFANPNTPTAANYAKLPMSFEPNQGQADSQFKFLARGSGYTLLLSPTEADLGLRSSSAGSSTHAKDTGTPSATNGVKTPDPYAILRLRFLGANNSAQIEGLDEQPGVSNYYVGNDPSKWHTNVPHFSRVRYKNLYPGIDIVYYGNQSQLEHDFIVAPGADPSKIRLRVDGAEKISLDADGNLLLSVSGGTLHFSKPLIYQQADGQTKTPVEGRYVRRGLHEIGFRVAAYNRKQSLIIDPVLAYASYLGGSANDTLFAVASDNAGGVYLTGSTTSTDFPLKNAYQATYGGSTTYSPPITNPPTSDAFITKIDTTQSGANSLVYSTFLGSGGVNAAGIELNGFGQPETVYFPLAEGVNRGTAIAVDGSGDAFVAGITSSFDFPIVGGINLYSGQTLCEFLPPNGPAPVCVAGAAFVAKFSASGALLFSTDLGGHLGQPDTTNPNGFDYPSVTPTGIAVDHNGIAYVAGGTPDPDFPMTANPFYGGFACVGSCNNLPANGFLTEFDPTKTGSASMIYSTLLYFDVPVGLALDASHDVYLAGSTYDGALVTQGTFQTSSLRLSRGGSAGFIAKFDFTKPGSSALLWGTLFPETIDGLAVGSDGSTYVSGRAFDNVLAPSPGAFDICTSAPAGDSIDTDCNGAHGIVEFVYVSKLNPTATSLTYTARLGGFLDGPDFGLPPTALAVDPNGNAFITGGALVSYLRPLVPVVTIGSPPPLPPFPPVALATFPGNLLNGDCLTATPACFGGAFVSMLNPQGSAIIYSYLLTADDNEFGYNTGSVGTAVSADGVGNAYFAGSAYSPAIPVTSNAFQSTIGGTSGVAYNAYVAKIPSAFPEATLSTNSLSFGNSFLSFSSPLQSAMLTNTGYAPLTIFGFTMTGANPTDFVIFSNDCPAPSSTLGIGDSCHLQFFFRASILGPESATLNIASNAAGTPTPQTFISFSGTGVPLCATDVTSSVSVTRSGYSYNPLSRRYAQTVTLKNNSASPIVGPISLALDGLSANATLLNSAGTTACAVPLGSPYVTLAGPLAPGASAPVVLQFTDPTRASFSYSTRVLAGAQP
jgi:hypothetical protein